MMAIKRVLRRTEWWMAVVLAVCAATLMPVQAAAQSASSGGVVAVANSASLSDIGTAASLVAAGEAEAVVFAYAADALGDAGARAVARRAPDGVLLVGGTAVLALPIENQVGRLAPQATIERLQGADRIETAALAAHRVLEGVRGSTVVIANGWSLSDVGTAASAVASGSADAVLYSAADGLGAPTSEVLRAVRPSRVLLVGGTAALSTSVDSELASALSTASVERIGGSDRTDTAAMFAGAAFNRGASVAVVANGWSLTDVGIAASLAAARTDAAVLYTQRDGLGDAASEAIAGRTLSEIILVGDTASLPAPIADEIAQLAPNADVERTVASDFFSAPSPDTNGPAVVTLRSTRGRTVSGPFEVDIDFSRPVAGFAADDIRVSNGQISGLRGSAASYQMTVTPAAAGTVTIWVRQGAARDYSGNPSEASTVLVRTFGADAHVDRPGFDTWNRAEVVANYRAEFEREEPDPQFTGNVEECDAGSTSQDYRDSVIQRVNWYRRMGGLEAVSEEPSYSAAAQAAALMMAAERKLSHYPASDWACHSSTGALGARSSNLGLGASGAYGIDRYIRDEGENNRSVGHRRWILRPSLSAVGTGNIPYQPDSRRSVTNALYVVGGHAGARRDVREARGFVAWPPAGYVPAETVWGRWSFQMPGADFGEATVTVTDSYGAVPAVVIGRQGSAIVWSVYGDSNSRELFDPTDGDFCYSITVSNVKIDNIVETPFQYATCLLDLEEQLSGGLYVSKGAMPRWSPDGSRVQFLRDGLWWLTNVDGVGQRPLALDRAGVWSPDGTRVATSGIWAMNADGTAGRQLSETGSAPSWSPDSKRIAHSVDGGTWSINADGTGLRQLTDLGFGPVWSPDGERIAYQATDGTWRSGWGTRWRRVTGLWVMNADGTNHRELSDANVATPLWSPDGSQILYGLYQKGIWVVNGDGTGLRQLTSSGFDPAWSPDGKRIAYQGPGGVWVMNSDGTNQRDLNAGGGWPAWSPDGTQIAYGTSREGIWVIDTDGTNKQQLTDSGTVPAWSPDGRYIAYSDSGEGHQLWVVDADGAHKRKIGG